MKCFISHLFSPNFPLKVYGIPYNASLQLRIKLEKHLLTVETLIEFVKCVITKGE